MSILGPEEIQKLAHGLQREELGLKRASGDGMIFWKDHKAAPPKKPKAPEKEGKVLAFARPEMKAEPPSEESEETSEEESKDGNLLSAEVILLQREITREATTANQKSSARAGYQRATEMYVVKTKSLDGKEKIHFASTNGVLINKKQA